MVLAAAATEGAGVALPLARSRGASAALRLRPTSGDQGSLTLTRRSVVIGAGVAREVSAKLLR